MTSNEEKSKAARKEQQRIHGVIVSTVAAVVATNYFVVHGEVVTRDDLAPEREPGEERQYRRQFPVDYHE